MKIVKWVAAGIAAVVLVLLVVAYLIPRETTVTRSVAVAAPASAIYALVADLRGFGEWSPWSEIDPATVYTFTGPTDGVGQTLNWQSGNPAVGSGSMAIQALDPDKRVDYVLHLGNGDVVPASLALEAGSGATTVTWTATVDRGISPLARYFGTALEARIGPDLEEGLVRLKSAAEKPPEPPAADK